tara:strand:- start:791 stop:1603 length:813 start_codon:yes stop_codon:yes gene_type:complete
MLIIGLGQAGCSIAELFKQHKQYHVEQLDEGKGLKKCSSVEEYDQLEYNPRKKGIKTASEGILFVCGSGKVAGATLRVLEGLKHVRMTVVYLCPDLEYASREEKLMNRSHFGILQQYARSGLLSEMMLLDNKILLDSAGHGTIYKYFEKANHLVYTIIHTLNYCNNIKPEFGSLHTPKEISRITTLGFGNVEENEEKLFFLLDNITETGYIININEDDLANDIDLLPNIKAMVGENKQLDRETSFAIWSTTEDTNYYYTKHYTHYIQEKT